MNEANSKTPDERPLSAGETLQKAREARGLTQQDVAQSLRLAPEMIAALETGSAEQLTGKVFVQGYLRAYARLVDVATEAVAPDDVTTLQAQEPFTPTPIQRTRPKKGYRRHSGAGSWVIGVVTLAAVILLGTQLWPLVKDGMEDVAVEPQDAAEETVPGQPSVFTREAANESDQVIADEPPVSMAAASTAAALPPASPFEEAEAGPELASALVEDEIEPADTAEAAPLAQVVLHFDADSWTEVSDARGERLMQSIGRMGSTVELSGVAPFDVLMGYAPGVNIEYNGEPYEDTRYQDRRVARITVGEAGDSATP